MTKSVTKISRGQKIWSTHIFRDAAEIKLKTSRILTSILLSDPVRDQTSIFKVTSCLITSSKTQPKSTESRNFFADIEFSFFRFFEMKTQNRVSDMKIFAGLSWNVGYAQKWNFAKWTYESKIVQTFGDQNICLVKNGKIWIQFPKRFSMLRTKYIRKSFFSNQKNIGLAFSHYDFENGISEATRGRKRLF